MNIRFTSEKYGDREWLAFKPERMMSTESEAIEGVTQQTFIQWGQALMNGSAICGRALVWILLRRENRALRFREIDYAIGDLKIELDDDEKTRVREELKRNDDLSEDDKRQILLSLGEPALDELDFEPGDEESADGSGNGEATGSVADSD